MPALSCIAANAVAPPPSVYSAITVVASVSSVANDALTPPAEYATFASYSSPKPSLAREPGLIDLYEKVKASFIAYVMPIAVSSSASEASFSIDALKVRAAIKYDAEIRVASPPAATTSMSLNVSAYNHPTVPATLYELVEPPWSDVSATVQPITLPERLMSCESKSSSYGL